MRGDDVLVDVHGERLAGRQAVDHADDDLDDLNVLERACEVQVLAQSTGRPLAPVDDALAARVGAETLGERVRSELHCEALRRTLP